MEWISSKTEIKNNCETCNTVDFFNFYYERTSPMQEFD